MQKSNKSLSIILSLLMIISTLSALPFTAHAISDEDSISGSVNYKFDHGKGELTISGSGAIPDYESTGENQSPFCKDYSIESVKIENGITSIGNYTFYKCANANKGGITRVELPNSLTRIGTAAFQECTKIGEIDIPDSVTTIGDYAFYGCQLATELKISNSLTSIGNYTFCGLSITSVTIPKNVTSIGNCAFKDCYLINLTIPNGVETIGSYAFGGCLLSNLSIPNSVTSIGEGAFNNCKGLTSVSLPNSITSISASTFNGCVNLASVSIPDSVKSINRLAFYSCPNLNDVYYGGTKEQWDSITIDKERYTGSPEQDGNDPLINATIHCSNGIINCKHLPENYTNTIVLPSCTLQGYTTHLCQCGKYFVDSYVKATGHKPDKGTVTKKPTYTTTGVKTYKCTVCKKVIKTETIAKLPKKANTLVAKGKTANIKLANLKKKNQVVTQKNAFAVSKAKGKVTYKKAGGNAKITVAKNGNITVKKGLKKGTYKIKVKVTAAGNTQYKAVTKTVTVVIKVK